MRKLETTDIFGFCRLVNSIGIKDEIKRIAMEANSVSDLSKPEVGFDVIYALFEKATEEKSEKELYKFCARLFECDAKDVAHMDAIEFIDKLLEVANVEQWKAFFTRVARLIQKQN